MTGIDTVQDVETARADFQSNAQAVYDVRLVLR
jgi:hypothetical protein